MNQIETLEYCKVVHSPSNWCKDRPLSQFVLAERDIVAAREYPYNATIERCIIEKHKLKLSDAEKTELGTLIYLAQDFAHKRDEANDDAIGGWVVSTKELLMQHVGKKVEIKGENMFGEKATGSAKVRVINNNVYIMPLRSKVKAYSMGTKFRLAVA